MNEIGQRANVKYFSLRSLTPRQVNEDVVATLSDLLYIARYVVPIRVGQVLK